MDLSIAQVFCYEKHARITVSRPTPQPGIRPLRVHLSGRMNLTEGPVTMIVSQEAEPNSRADRCCSWAPPFLPRDDEESDLRQPERHGT